MLYEYIISFYNLLDTYVPGTYTMMDSIGIGIEWLQNESIAPDGVHCAGTGDRADVTVTSDARGGA